MKAEDEEEKISIPFDASDDREDDNSYEDDFEDDDDDDDDDDDVDDDDDDDTREISMPRKDGRYEISAKAEQEKLLSKIADLENELAVEQSKTAEAVIQEREGLETEITQLKIKFEEAKIELENAKKLSQVKGKLWKRGVHGPTSKIWRRRWFEAEIDGRLYYYKRKNRKRIQKGFVQIDRITAVEDLPSSVQNEENSCFNVVTPDRIYELKARDKDEKSRWISDLNYLMSRCPNRQASINDHRVSSALCTLV